MNRSEWHTTEVELIAQNLGVDIHKGLSAKEAERRLKIQGKNVLPAPEVVTLFSIIFRQLKSPIIYILIFAGILTFFIKEYIDALVILITILVNVGIGAFQEGRANNTFATLSKSQTHSATVIRDEVKRIIPSTDLVVGDVVRLESGTYVPADIRLFDANNLEINESSLTGEWVGISKETDRSERALPLAEQRNMAWMGTFAMQGYGRGVVVASGADTEFGKLAESLASVRQRSTPLQKYIHSLANLLLIIIAISVALVAIIGYFRGIPGVELLLIIIAVSVALVPEGLPAAVTVVLAVGMENILKKGGLVRNLLAAETLGSTTVIMTDKTGTLTEGNMALSGVNTYKKIQGEEDEKGEMASLRAGILASDAFIDHTPEGDIVVHGRPIERAILNAGIARELNQERLREKSKRIDYLQFESKRRFGASVHEEDGELVLYLSGAPEHLLEAATQYVDGTTVKKMSEKVKKIFTDFQLKESSVGHRMTAIARKVIKDKDFSLGSAKDAELLEGTIFMALFVFSDPIRGDVSQSIETARGAGARVLMVTGDNPATARSIAEEVGIIKKDTEGVVHTGDDTVGLTDAELGEMIEHTDVFARVLPDQKLRISRILKNRGEVVAMTGDGVNDAPALRSADIGIALGSGTEVAKEASDLVLINNSFSVIVSAIAEGRKIIDNLRKIVSFLLTTGFGELFVVSGALIIGGPLPILPIQILWTNVIGGSFISVALAFEGQEKGIMKRSPRNKESKSVLSKRLIALTLITACTTGIILIGVYLLLLANTLPISELHTVIFILLSTNSFFFVFSLKSLSLPIWKIRFFSNHFLIMAVLFSAVLLACTLYVPPLRSFLDLAVPSGFSWMVIGGATVLFVSVLEIMKALLFGRKNVE
ncbi:MAG: HAD-IC family P-type ATPase [Candidatus Paceibacterota bacterium]